MTIFKYNNMKNTNTRYIFSNLAINFIYEILNENNFNFLFQFKLIDKIII